MARIFGWSLVVAVVGLAGALLYGGPQGLALAAILGVLEVSLSFDNAVVNATVLRRMNAFWQRIFLTVGVLVAVFGMRLLFPFLVVGVTARLTPARALRLALEKGDPTVPGTYGYLLHQAHPLIAAFGGMFLLMLFLRFVLEEHEVSWLTWIERPLARLGRLDEVATAIALVVLAVVASTFAADRGLEVAVSGAVGVVAFLLITSLGELFESGADDDGEEAPRPGVAVAAGKAALLLFLYLEVLDASFSFDGVIGAFAITSDPVLIAIGLGIGAMFIRSITVFLVRNGTLSQFVYLEHGALWAIGALAAILLATIRWDVPELVTGAVGVAFIGAGWLSSVVHNRREVRERDRVLVGA